VLGGGAIPLRQLKHRWLLAVRPFLAAPVRSLGTAILSLALLALPTNGELALRQVKALPLKPLAFTHFDSQGQAINAFKADRPALGLYFARNQRPVWARTNNFRFVAPCSCRVGVTRSRAQNLAGDKIIFESRAPPKTVFSKKPNWL